MKKTPKIIMLTMVFAVAILLVNANKPVFQNVQDYVRFNLTQGKRFTFFIVATDADSQYPLNFSHDNQPPNFPSFRLKNYNATAALMNFTPTNWDVGLVGVGKQNWTVCVTVKENKVDPMHETVCMYFRVQNVNDPPNITWWFPTQTQVGTKENVSVGFYFNYSASDIDIPWGDVINASWWYDKLVKNVSHSVNGSWKFYPDFCSAGKHNITLRAMDINGSMNSHNWSLTINNTNRKPLFNQTIANITWPEHTARKNNITLSEHFLDLDNIQCSYPNKDNLTYKVTGNSHITVTINQSTSKVSFSAPYYWSGVETVRFTVNDSYSTATSNFVKLNVSFINNPPIMTFIPNQTLTVGLLYTNRVNGTDPDEGQTLTYTSNSSFFTIGKFTGLINFTPKGADWGVHSIVIVVNDSTLFATQVVKFTVINNTKPYIQTLEQQNATEGTAFQTTINATDVDMDNITISDNASFFNVVDIKSTGKTEGRISFTPNYQNVGTHYVKFTALDSRGATNFSIVRFNIFEYNYQPTFPFLNNISIRINKTYMMNITASDPDPTEKLTFSSNSSIFIIDQSNKTTPALSRTIINITDSAKKGIYVINITVTDNGTGHRRYSQMVKFSVAVNNNPQIRPVSNKTSQEDHFFSMAINGYDPDQDKLTYHANDSMLNLGRINNTAYRINFTPTESQIGMHAIKVNVTDEYGGINWTVFIINVTSWNDPPYFLTTQRNFTFWEEHNTTVNITGFDEEGANLTMWANNSLFNFTILNRSTSYINLMPFRRDVGNYTVNVTLSDGAWNVSQLFLFRVLGINHRPKILDYVPNRTTTSLKENSTILFNITKWGDAENDSIQFRWYLGSQIKSLNQSWKYRPGFCDSGTYTVTVVLAQPNNDNTTMYWNITVNNSNRGPYLSLPMPNLNWPEDHSLADNLTLTDYFYDPDFQECNGSQRDNLTFSSSGTHYVNILISKEGKASFIPSTDWNGVEKAEFSLNDSHNVIYGNNITLTVTPVEDPPTLLQMGTQVAKVGDYFTAYVNASDPDNERLSFSSNSSMFNLTQVSNTKALINFTVLSRMVGNTTVNISVTDGFYTASMKVLFVINGTNKAPNITQVYPYGWPLANVTTYAFQSRQSFPKGTRVNISENKSITFTTIVFEPDGDTVYYKWLLDGIAVSTESSFSYPVGFEDSGHRNVTLIVRDRIFNTDSFYWNVSVKNVNRNPHYGIKALRDYSDFSQGTLYRTNISKRYGNITLDRVNATHFQAKGSYTSPVIDFQTDSFSSLARPNLTLIKWTAMMPKGTNVTVQTRTRGDSGAWSEWSSRLSNSSGAIINITTKFVQNASPATWDTRYLQFRFNLSTNNRTISPEILASEILYNIPDFVIVQDHAAAKWFDLDDYFRDDDNETLQYNWTSLINTERLGISISSDHYVNLNPEQSWSGDASLMFNAKDNKGKNVSSEIVYVSVKKLTQVSTPQQSSSGGGATKFVAVPQKERVNVTQPVSLKLVMPKPFIVSSALRIVAPVELLNRGNITLRGIDLIAQTSEPNISLEFDNPFVLELAPGERTLTNLVVSLSEEKKTPYQINVTATSKEPHFVDTAVLSINPLPFLEAMNETVRFVRDLLSTNPECLELNELMVEARNAIQQKQYDYAQKLLSDAVDACRYLISGRTKATEQPQEQTLSGLLAKFVKDNQMPLFLVSVGMLLTIGYSAFVILKNRRRFRPS